MRFGFIRPTAATLFTMMAFSVPANAAPAGQISCVHDAFTPGQERQIVAALASLVTGDEDDKHTVLRASAKQWMERGSASCTTRYGWDKAEGTLAREYAMMSFFRSAVKADPALAKVDFAALDAFTAEQRRVPSDAELTDAEMRGVAAILKKSATGVDLTSLLAKALGYVRSNFKLAELKHRFALDAAGRAAFERAPS